MPQVKKRRRNNERKFPDWDDLPDGGRRYRRRVPGRSGWSAVYEKVVDAQENTLSFRQLIHDSSGRLVEVHEKFPRDLGHKKVETEQ